MAPVSETVLTLLSTLPADSCLSLDEIVSRCGLTRKQVSDAMARLSSWRLAERLYVGCYAASDKGREAAAAGVRFKTGPKCKLGHVRTPIRGTFRQKLWHALRMARRATVPELLSTIGADHDRRTINNAHQYLRGLIKAGIVVQLSRRIPGRGMGHNGHIVFVLVTDLGPFAPRVTRQGLFDPNRNELKPWPKTP